jgi:hypothetical protein
MKDKVPYVNAKQMPEKMQIALIAKAAMDTKGRIAFIVNTEADVARYQKQILAEFPDLVAGKTFPFADAFCSTIQHKDCTK